jgi:hypothetical protein
MDFGYLSGTPSAPTTLSPASFYTQLDTMSLDGMYDTGSTLRNKRICLPEIREAYNQP